MVLKKVSILFFIYLFGFYFVFSQSGLKRLPNTEFIEDPNQDPFLISTRPITNREYLIYLVWNLSIADDSFRFIEAFPCLDSIGTANVLTGLEEYKKTIRFNYYDPCLFTLCYNNADSIVKYYFTNPQFLDYPVLGLSQMQANRFCKWFSDRYNEETLVKQGYLYFNPNQYGEDVFVSESYLINQYQGLQRKKAWKKPIITWKDHIFIPAFRLPTQHELKLATKSRGFQNQLKAYPFTKTNILYDWFKYFRIKTKKYIEFYFGCDGFVPFGESNSEFSTDSINPLELTFDATLSLESDSIISIFRKLNLLFDDSIDIDALMLKRKNRIGQMDFIIAGEKNNGQPILIKNYDNIPLSNLELNKYTIFRYACNMRYKQYMP